MGGGASGRFIDQHGVRTDFECESDGFSFPGIERQMGDLRWDGARRGKSNPRRQDQAVKARVDLSEPCKFVRDHHRRADFPEETNQQFLLADAAKIDQHRSIGHD